MTPFQKIQMLHFVTCHYNVVSLEHDKEMISFLKHTLDNPMGF